MHASAVVLAVASCGGTPVPAPISNATPAQAPERYVTELHVDVANHIQLQDTCAQVPPRRYAITLDGRDVATVDVPCATGFQAPAPRSSATPFQVPPGIHQIGIRDVESGRSAQREFRFPVLEPARDDAGRRIGSFVADQLLMHAERDRLWIAEPRLFNIGL